MKKSTKDFKAYFFCLAIVVTYLIFGYNNDVLLFLKKEPFRRYPSVPSEQNLTYRFKDNSFLLGNVHKKYRYFENPGLHAQGVYAVDVNNDGFDDVLYIQTDENARDQIVLLINNNGSFSDQTSKFGIIDLLENESPVAAATSDFNNDGFQDLVLSFENHKVLVAFGDGKHFSLQRSVTYFLKGGDSRSISVLDYDRDGFLDIYIGSQYKDQKNWTPLHWSRENDCGKSQLLRNIKGNSFIPVSTQTMENNTRCTFTTFAADFNGDGYTDIYSPADYGVDKVYQNIHGEKLIDSTRSSLGYLRSRASMGVDAADIYGEGKLSLYVANTDHNLGLKIGMNSLWYNVSSPKTMKFEDIGTKINVDQCGHSWGTRFLDPDRNGQPDLFVTNATTRTIESYWNLRFYFIVTPDIFQDYLKNDIFFYTPKKTQKTKPCFFQNNGKNQPWNNIAESLGLEKYHGVRSATIFDYNNDGQEDILLGKLYGSPLLLEGNYSGKNKWIGVKLIGVISNRDGVGARVFLKTKSLNQLKEVTVGGSFQSNNSKKLIFGIPETELVDGKASMEIHWPSGQIQYESINSFNKYISIEEKK